MEDFSIRAIVIGVSLFVTMLTLTAIIMYFNTARGIADEVNKRTDIASSYDYIMNSDDFTDKLTGVEVRSLINKYAGRQDVTINIVKIGNEEVKEYININNTWLLNINDENEKSKIIKEDKLNLINPVWNCRVDKVENKGKITLNISLNVED